MATTLRMRPSCIGNGSFSTVSRSGNIFTGESTLFGPWVKNLAKVLTIATISVTAGDTGSAQRPGGGGLGSTVGG
jgi:hypothetical protein